MFGGVIPTYITSGLGWLKTTFSEVSGGFIKEGIKSFSICGLWNVPI